MRGATVFVLFVLCVSCARQGAIPGGPPDRVAPIVVTTEPEPFAMLEVYRDPIVIRFNERISERGAGGTLDDAVIVSPVLEDVRVTHKRDALEVTAPGGFPAGVVYRVTVLPQIQDMFSNTMRDPFELVFSTGPEIEPAVVAGSVSDRITGQPAQVRVDLVSAADSLRYTSRSDAQGVFAVRYLAPGRYQLTSYEDRNRNGEADFSEPQASTLALVQTPGDTAIYLLEVLQPDSTAARVVGIEVADSLSLRLEFDDYMDPELPLNTVQVQLTREEGGAPRAERVLHPAAFDELVQERAQRAAEEARARADSAARAADTTGAEPQAGPALAPPEPPDSTDAEPPAEPLPRQEIFVVLDGPLEPGVPYEVAVSGVTNINRIPLGGGQATVVRERPPEPDSVPADSTAVPDSAAARDTTAIRDTTVVPDTVALPDRTMPDSATVRPDTAAFPDTIGPDTSRVRYGHLHGR